MCVDAHVAGSARQAFVFPVWYVLMCFWVYVFLGQTKVYYMYDVLFLVGLSTNEKVLRFDIAVDEVLGVNILHACDL